MIQARLHLEGLTDTNSHAGKCLRQIKKLTDWYKAVRDFVLKRLEFVVTVNSFVNLHNKYSTLLTVGCALHGKTWKIF
jgi:hypothetical protein